MNAKRYLARSTAIAARALGDETMVMSATDSTLFTLNEVATVIWEAADGTTPLEEIVADKICMKYDVPPEVALKDAEGLVAELAEHGLLLISDQPIQRAKVAAA
ncbi:MAG: PqqD family protein [Candidatus Acidiferrum sp.]